MATTTSSHDEAQAIFDGLKRRGKWKRYEISEVGQANPNVFVEHCFSTKQYPVHRQWQRIANQNNRVVVWSPPEHGKTFQYGFGRLIWLMGKYPTRSFAHLSATADIPEASLDQVAKHIFANAKVREIFPDLKIARFGRTATHIKGIWLERPGGHVDRDPSAIATGVMKQILGRRLDFILLDDIHDFDNTYTKASRAKVKGRISDVVLTRISAEGQIIYIGHPWAKDDAGHWLAEKEGWASYRFDVEENAQGERGAFWWPEKFVDEMSGRVYGWPWERIVAKKAETDPLTWWRVWKCRTPQEEMELFPYSLILHALQRGRGLGIGRQCPPGIRPVSGVDLATGTGNDMTVITTGYFAGGQRHILDIRAGLWDDPKLYAQMRDILRKYPTHGGFMVEDNGFQQSIVNTLRRAEVMRAYGWRDEDMEKARVLGWTTSARNKGDAHIGIRALAVDLSTNMLVLPADTSGKPEAPTQRLIEGMQDYDPTEPTVHTSDYLISYWLCCEMMRRLGQVPQGSSHLGLT